MEREKDTRELDITELAESLINNIGSGFFTAVIDDHHYYDENLDVKEFQDGCIYYPSSNIAALGIHDDDDGESFVYHDQPDKPRFTYYTNVGYMLSKATANHQLMSDPIRCTAMYDSYLDLPSWMGVDQFTRALQKLKSEKEYELGDTIRYQELRNHRKLFIETMVTGLVLILQSILIIPIIVEHSFWVRFFYFVPAFLILSRFIGRSIRLFIIYRRSKEDYDKSIIRNKKRNEKKETSDEKW